LTEAEDKLVGKLLQFREQIKSPQPTAYLSSGSIIDFSIIPLEKYAGYETKHFDTLNELLDAIYAKERITVDNEENKAKIEEIEKSIEQQKKLAQEYKEKAKEYREIGNKIYEYMYALNELIKKVGKEKANIENQKTEENIEVTRINRQNKTMRVVLP